METAVRRGWTLALVAAIGLGLWGGGARAGTYSVVHAFNGADGARPYQPVLIAPDGSLYGGTIYGSPTCIYGPSFYCGTLFAIDAANHFSTLHLFSGPDGQGLTTGLARVGATLFGGASTFNAYGLLFSINTDGSGFTVLHTFTGIDGFGPAGILQPVGGTVYGVTAHGGLNFDGADPVKSDGVLFSILADGSYHVLHDFAGGADGVYPSQLVVDAAGNLFGSTTQGGRNCSDYPQGCGTLFEYTPATGSYKVLRAFSDADGVNPQLGSVGAGDVLYGTTGAYGSQVGTLFSATPVGTHAAFSTLHVFTSGLGSPTTGPVVSASGVLVGALLNALYDYRNGQYGVLLTLSTGDTGNTIYAQPQIGPGTAVYGTTYMGGDSSCVLYGVPTPAGCGVVYKYSAH